MQLLACALMHCIRRLVGRALCEVEAPAPAQREQGCPSPGKAVYDVVLIRLPALEYQGGVVGASAALGLI